MQAGPGGSPSRTSSHAWTDAVESWTQDPWRDLLLPISSVDQYCAASMSLESVLCDSGGRAGNLAWGFSISMPLMFHVKPRLLPPQRGLP